MMIYLQYLYRGFTKNSFGFCWEFSLFNETASVHSKILHCTSETIIFTSTDHVEWSAVKQWARRKFPFEPHNGIRWVVVTNVYVITSFSCQDCRHGLWLIKLQSVCSLLWLICGSCWNNLNEYCLICKLIYAQFCALLVRHLNMHFEMEHMYTSDSKGLSRLLMNWAPVSPTVA